MGSVLRNTYPSHAVLLGMLAAAAAEAGFDMPRGALEEGRRRILKATNYAPPTPAGRWTILDGYLKPFAGVRHTHYGVEAALRLRKHPAFSLEQISDIRLQTYGEAVQYCGIVHPARLFKRNSACRMRSPPPSCSAISVRRPTRCWDPTIVRLEQSVVVEVDPVRLRRGANLIVDVGEKRLTENVEDVAGDGNADDEG